MRFPHRLSVPPLAPIASALLCVACLHAQSVTASAAAVSSLSDSVALGSVQRTVTTPAGTSLTAGLSQSVALPDPWSGGDLARATTTVQLRGTPATGWHLVLAGAGSASVAASGASSSSTTGPHTLLLRLVAPVPVQGQLTLRYAPRTLPPQGTATATFDIDHDGTIELTGNGATAALSTVTTTVGPAGLLVAVTHSASLSNVAHPFAYDVQSEVEFRPTPRCTPTALGPGCGNLDLQVLDTFSGETAFQIRGASPSGLTYLVLGLAPLRQTVPVRPFCTQWITTDLIVPILPDMLGNAELVAAVPLAAPWTIHAQVVALDLANLRVHLSPGWTLACP